MKQFLNARFGIQLAAGIVAYTVLSFVSSFFLPSPLSALLGLTADALVFVAAGEMYDQNRNNPGGGAA